jgi:predicted DNA-binding transcriptional regulator YafY
VATSGQRFRPRELPTPDALSFVQAGIRQMPQRHQVRVRIGTDPHSVAELVGDWGTVEPVDGGCVLSMNVDSLEWPLVVLAQLEADFEVQSPPELQEMVARTAERFGRATR